MTNISQSKLQHHVHMLVTNGQLSPAQTALAQVGYDLTALAAGEALLQTWLAGQARVKTLLADQKRATQAEHEARQMAQAEINRFCQTVRILFGQDEPLLTLLGLWPRRTGTNSSSSKNGEPTSRGEPVNGKPKPRVHYSRSTAQTIARWRLLLTNAQTINGAHQAQLAGCGWTSTRLTAAAALVENYVAAELNQQQQVQAYQAEAGRVKEAELALRRWYDQATRLSKLAIQQTSPAQQGQLKELLGL